LRDLRFVEPSIKKEFQGLILAGGDKFFSIGFDLPLLLKCTHHLHYYKILKTSAKFAEVKRCMGAIFPKGKSKLMRV
jgi:hypothetical protein